MVQLTKNASTIDITCDSAGEFTHILSPLSGAFVGDASSDAYMFRGVGSALFDLIPSAFRKGVELILNNEWVYGPLPDRLRQCEAELHTVRRFFEIAARHGLRLPEDSMTLREKLDEWVDLLAALHDSPKAFPDVVWPPPDFYSLIALAQHHGVPTRVLDWSASALTAAYFAAGSPNQLMDDYIVVWVHRRGARRGARFTDMPNTGRSLVIFSAPSADNDNLRAQRGIFSLYPERLSRFAIGAYDHTSGFGGWRPDDTEKLIRIMVHTSESQLVLAALTAAGVTAGALFPGFWGVARELREERRLVSAQARDRVAEDVIARVQQLLHRTGA